MLNWGNRDGLVYGSGSIKLTPTGTKPNLVNIAEDASGALNHLQSNLSWGNAIYQDGATIRPNSLSVLVLLRL